MSESVNPNVDTTSTPSEGVKASPGESITSFADLDSALKAAPKESSKEAPKDKLIKEPKEEKEKAPKEDKKPSIKEAAAQKKAENAEKARVKKILAKLGEEETELDPGLVLKHKISGQDVDVPLSDLLNEFSGKTDWTRKYTDLDKERKEFLASRDSFNSNLKQFHQLSQEDPQGAMEFLFDLYGQDGRNALKGLHEKWLERYQNYSEMDEDQRRAVELEDENNYYKRKSERYEQQQQEAQKLSQLQQSIAKIQKQYGMNDQQFMQAYQELAASPEVAEATKANPNFELTPQHVAAYYQIKSIRDATESAVMEANPDFDGNIDDVHQEVDFIRAKNPDFTTKDIVEIIAQVYSPKNQSKSMKGKVVDHQASKKVEEKTKKPVLFFSDL